MHDRHAGVLAHVSSLPGDYGIGDLGGSAHDFARIMSEWGVKVWQMLPLVPTEPGAANSPYSSSSAFAGNPLFISPGALVEAGLLEPDTAEKFKVAPSDRVDYRQVYDIKERLLLAAHGNFRRDGACLGRFKKMSDDFWNFCVAEAYWLEDYALYSVLKRLEGGKGWSEWREDFKFRNWSVLDPLKNDPDVARALDIKRFEQFLFYSQLDALTSACRELGIEVIGDLPIYVAYDSADVWGHQGFFELDESGRPTVVAGVPPDYFSRTGQRWGNPIYRWDRLKRDGYGWWTGRVRHALRCANRVRIDHFRGFMGYWAIPEEEPTAENGEWREGPGQDFFAAMERALLDGENGTLPFIAEDLGVLTEDVTDAMARFRLPGMKVLHFAFGDGMPQNPYALHNHAKNSVAFIGTHDNNTTVGWWENDACELEKSNFTSYINRPGIDARGAVRAMTRLALASTASLAVITLQDILELDARARMNTPSTTSGNWEWKLADFRKLKEEGPRLSELMRLYGRHAGCASDTLDELPEKKEV